MTERKNKGKGHRGTKASGRDYQYERAQMTPAAKSRNAKQTKLRRAAIKDGRVSRGDGTHLAHTGKAGSKGGGFSLSNVKVTSPEANRRRGNR